MRSVGMRIKERRRKKRDALKNHQIKILKNPSKTDEKKNYDNGKTTKVMDE